jgi:hypothetical protein
MGFLFRIETEISEEQRMEFGAHIKDSSAGFILVFIISEADEKEIKKPTVELLMEE